MAIQTSERQPSDDLDELREQLLRELERLKSGEAEDPDLYQAYLEHAQTLAWQGVAEGRIDAPREVLDRLLAAQPFVDLHLPRFGGTAGKAAVEVRYAMHSLYVAVEALHPRWVEDRLADRRSETEREVLRVLSENQGHYLRRGDIHERLRLPKAPTPARVGQILVELQHEGLLYCIHGRAQGNPNTAFYHLSPQGLEVCQNLEIAPVVQPSSAKISAVAEIALDPRQSAGKRDIALGLLANVSADPTPIVQILNDVAQRSKGNATAQSLLLQALGAVMGGWQFRSASAAGRRSVSPLFRHP